MNEDETIEKEDGTGGAVETNGRDGGEQCGW